MRLEIFMGCKVNTKNIPNKRSYIKDKKEKLVGNKKVEQEQLWKKHFRAY